MFISKELVEIADVEESMAMYDISGHDFDVYRFELFAANEAGRSDNWRDLSLAVFIGE